MFHKRYIPFVIGTVFAILILVITQESGQGPKRCRFGQEYGVIQSEKKLYDAIELVLLKDKPILFWSNADGLHALALTKQGMRDGPEVRIDSRCLGGIDAFSDGEAVYLACLRRWKQKAELSQDLGAAFADKAVTIYLVDHELKTRWVQRIGALSPMSKGVSLTADSHGKVYVVWHSGFPEEHSVWYTVVNNQDSSSPRAISSSSRSAGAPFILSDNDKVYIVWAETWMVADELKGAIMLYDGKSAPYSIHEVTYHAAMPQLAKQGENLLLAFQDQPSLSHTVGLYFVRLGKDGHPLGEVVRVARADTEERPSIDFCHNGIVAASPRTYGNDRLIGVNWYDDSFNQLSGEQQFCEDTREFSLAKAICIDSKALLLIGERGASTQKYTRVRSVTFFCSS